MSTRLRPGSACVGTLGPWATCGTAVASGCAVSSASTSANSDWRVEDAIVVELNRDLYVPIAIALMNAASASTAAIANGRAIDQTQGSARMSIRLAGVAASSLRSAAYSDFN